MWGVIGMRYYKIGRSVFVSLLVVLSASFVPRLPMALMTSRVLAQNNDARKAEAEKVMQRGREQFQSSQFTAALQSWQQALLIYREIKERQGEGKALVNLGLAYHSLGDYRKAIEYYQQSLPILRAIIDRKTEGIVLYNFGNTYDSLGDYGKAIEYHQQSLKIAQEIKDPQGQAAVFGGLGNAYYGLGDYRKAIEHHQQHLKIAREIEDRQGEGAALTNLGSTYNTLGDYRKAIEYHQQSLKIAQEIKYPLGERLALGNLGLVYNNLGDNLKAIEYQQQSLKITREIEDRQGEGATLGNIGIAYLALGDYFKAIEYGQQMLKISQKIKNPLGEITALNNLCIAYSYLGDNLKAIDYCQQSLKIAQEIKDRLVAGNALGSLGNIYYRLRDYPKAIEYQQQRLKISQEINDRRGEGAALNNLGLTYYKQGNFKLAESILFEGIKVLESLRDQKLEDSNKVDFYDTQSSIYRILQEVFIAQNKYDKALEIAERGRGRAFVELLTSQIDNNSKEQYLIPPYIDQIKQTAKNQNSTLVQYSIIGNQFKVAGKLQTKESKLYIWVIKPTGEVTFRKADLKPLWQKENTTLSELVSTTRKSLGVSDDERSIFSAKVKNPVNEKIQRESLQKLHQLLVKPIADLLPTDPNQRVTFVPQSDLFLVPFPALIDSKGKYLIEKHTILTAPAIQVLELTRQQQKRIKTLPKSSRKNALIVGNPTMPSFNTKYGESGKQLSSLPGAKREAEAIAPLFNTTALTGDEATETTIKAKLPQAGLIHLATHGLFDGFQGLQSSIALAPSSQDNGLLTASEILDIKLNADLVVLSACNTGRGRITGDGVIGLSRSLISAGVPSVLVSLWSVPDSPTASLMTDFYQNLSKNPDKATALRQAMLTRMKKHPNPRDWAAFTLIGEAE